MDPISQWRLAVSKDYFWFCKTKQNEWIQRAPFERLDVLCLEKLWSSVRHRRRRSVSDVGAGFILDVDAKRYLRVGSLLRFLWVSIIEMRTFVEKTPTQNCSQNNNISKLFWVSESGEVPDCHFYTVAKTCSSLNGLYNPDHPLWGKKPPNNILSITTRIRTLSLSAFLLCRSLCSNKQYLMTHTQKGRDVK